MKISTKGRYALRVMIDLAEHNTGEYIPLMDIARRQDISEKYLEAIVEIAELVGNENIFTFGEDSQTVIDRYARGDYYSRS